MTIDEFKIKHKNLIDRGVIKFADQHPYLTKTTIKNAVDAAFPIKDSVDDVLQWEKKREAELKSMDMFGGDYIIVDRFDANTNEFIATKEELNSPRIDLHKLGYTKNIGTGIYKKR